jgi:hypothetical protein
MRILLLTLLGACLIAASGARAADADNDLVPDDLEARTERVLAARAYPAEGPTSLYVRSEARDGSDAIEMDWAEGALAVAYLPEPSGAPALGLTVQLDELVEFVDADGDGFPKATEKVALLDLDGPVYRPGAFSRLSLEDGAQSATLTVGRSAVTLRVEVASRFQPGEGRAVSPIEVAVGLGIEDYRYDSAVSRLALRLTVHGQATASAFVPGPGVALAPGESARSFAAGEHVAYLAWDGEAMADGQGAPVAASLSDEAEGPWAFSFSYPHTEASISHAFRVGVVSDAYVAASAPPESPAPLFAVSALAIGGFVAATAVWVRRR